MTVSASTSLEAGNPDIEIIYARAETFLMNYSYFDLKTIDALISFLQVELDEVRDDSRSKYIVRLIRRLHKSDINLKKLENNTQTYNHKLNQFIDYGLQYYIDLVKVNIKNPSLCSRMYKALFFSSRDFDELSEITKNLKRSQLGESNFTNTLSSPMEEAQDSYSEVVQGPPPSPSLLDNCHIVDPNKVSVVFQTDATPEKL